MTIDFKLSQYYDICDKYDEKFSGQEPSFVEDSQGNAFDIKPMAVTIPRLKIVFREAIWYTRNEDDDSEEEWEIQDLVYMIYANSEKDLRNYISFTTVSIDYAIEEICGKEGYPFENRSMLECSMEIDDTL